MERGFLSKKGSGRGRGVKEKSINRNMANTALFTTSDGTLNDVTPGASVVKEAGTPSVVDMSVEKEVQSPVVDQTNTKEGCEYTYFIYTGGNGIDVVVPVELIRAISERFVNTAYGFFLGKRVAYLVVTNYVRNTWGKFGLVKSMLNSSTGLFSFQFSTMDGLNSMLENGPWFIRNHLLILRKWNLDIDLLKEDVGNVSVYVKLLGVPVTAFSEDGLSDIATKLVLTQKGVVKNVKKPSQTYQGVPVGPKVGFKPHKEYRPVAKKPTASFSGNKKKGVESTNEVSNSNSFEVLNSVDNDGDTSTTPVIDKIEKFEDVLIDGQDTLVDEDGNPLKKVEYPGDYDREDEDLPQEIQAICDNLDIRVRGHKKK
ncbi:probable leucine-rich repeat receptor-like protein kinase [Tanacetum coccineum]|uniref:Probable leucine-rich repeat receptor-like protein kinase n=1 Tax=Tanacetum coccineum TaxID=301880 RepID=A0ABQ5A095_9ASTR